MKNSLQIQMDQLFVHIQYVFLKLNTLHTRRKIHFLHHHREWIGQNKISKMIGKKDVQQEKKEVLGRMLARDLAHLI